MREMLGTHRRPRTGMVLKMENFSLNSAKSYLGKNVNLHLKDGSVIVNVHLTSIKKNDAGKVALIEFTSSGRNNRTSLPLRFIAWAEQLNPNLLLTAN
jgi:hypothetical protein